MQLPLLRQVFARGLGWLLSASGMAPCQIGRSRFEERVFAELGV